jgi:virginiamycin B lyase
MWFTEWGSARVGAIDANGRVEHAALAPGSEPHGLALGPDGAVWVALEAGSLVRLDPAAAAP